MLFKRSTFHRYFVLDFQKTITHKLKMFKCYCLWDVFTCIQILTFELSDELTSVRIVVSYEGWYFSFSCGALFSIFSRSVFCFLSAPLGWITALPRYLKRGLQFSNIAFYSCFLLCFTLKTLIWQEAEWRCSVYSSLSFSLNVSIWTRNGTPFSPPCFRIVNSVLIQWTYIFKRKGEKVDWILS